MRKSLIKSVFLDDPALTTARKYLFRPSRLQPLARLKRGFDRHRPSVLTTGQDSRARSVAPKQSYQDGRHQACRARFLSADDPVAQDGLDHSKSRDGGGIGPEDSWSERKP